MEKKTNYGKIVAVTLAVITAASTIAYVIYRLARNFFTFCDTYSEDDFEIEDFDTDDLPEEEEEDLLFPEEVAEDTEEE